MTNTMARFPSIRGVHTGLPSYFRALRSEASRQTHRTTYADVGRTLMCSLHREVPIDIEDDEWSDLVEDLKISLDNNHSGLVLRWLDLHLPRFFALIPRRRYEQFLKGVFAAHEEGLLDN